MTLQVTNLTPITTRLAALKRTVRAWVLADCLWRLGALMLVFVLVSAALDLLFRFDPAQRAIILALFILEACRLLWIKLLRPLARRMRDDDMLARVERRHPETGESILSAVQFSRQTDPAALGVSGEMMRAAIENGVGRAGEVDFSDIVDRRRLRRNSLRAAAAFVALAALLGSAAVAYPNELGTWFNRMVLIGSEQWPRQTTLELVDEHSRLGVMPRGDDWNPRATASGQIPDMVEIDFRPEGQRRPVTEVMRRVGDSTFTFAFRNVREPFEYRIRGGDHRTDWQPMRLVERPASDDLEVTVIPPEYQVERSPQDTRREPYVIPPGRSTEYIYPGSALQIDARANKPLQHASIRRDGQVVANLYVSEDDDGEPRRIHGDVPPDAVEDGIHEVFLIDADGLPTRRPDRIALSIREDEPPQVRSELVGISSMVVPRATIPIDSRIQDDFAVERVGLAYQVASPRQARRELEAERDRIAGDNGEEPEVIDLTDEPQVDEEDIEEDRIIEMRSLVDQFGRSRVEGRYQLELRELDVEVGQTISFTVDAWDNDDVVGPNRGQSNPFVLRVVDRDTLMQALMRREQEQRREMQRMLDDHNRMHTRILAVEADVAERLEREATTAMGSDERGEIGVAEQTQRLASVRAVGIAEQFAEIMLEHENNRLDDEGGSGALRLRRQIERQVVGALLELAEGAMVEAAASLDAAMRTDDAAEAYEAVRHATDRQRHIIEELKKIIEVMGTWENYRQIISEYRARLREQEELRDSVRERMEQEVEDLFD